MGVLQVLLDTDTEIDTDTDTDALLGVGGEGEVLSPRTPRPTVGQCNWAIAQNKC